MNDELSGKRKDVLLKHPDKYVHKITVEYDAPRVKAFMAKWQEEVDKRQNVVDNFDEALEESVSTSLAEFENTLNELQTGIEEDLLKSKEQLMQELYDSRIAQIKEQQDYLAAADKHKEVLVESVKKKLLEHKSNHLEKLKTKKDAIKFWSKPKTK